jgi:hypothetical protein
MLLVLMWIAWIFMLVGFSNAKHFILKTDESLKTHTINADDHSNSSSKLGAKVFMNRLFCSQTSEFVLKPIEFV